MGTEQTDWDAYYARPALTARVTRQFTQRTLISLMARHCHAHPDLAICELGGANSVFAEPILRALPVRSYHIIDTNARGLALLSKRVARDPRLSWERGDVLLPDPIHFERYDLVFSVGLIEHFSAADTQRSIDTHFAFARVGGVVLLTFPTPTWLYRVVRRGLEITGNWTFPDERPLGFAEVAGAVSRRGRMVCRLINWPVVLTQGIVVAQRVPVR